MSYRATILRDTPVAYWRLGEAAGATTAVDASGNGHDGTYTGGVTLGQSGPLVRDADTAALFDGVDDYVSVPDSPGVSPTAAVSMEAWVYQTQRASGVGTDTVSGVVGKNIGGTSVTNPPFAIWVDQNGRIWIWYTSAPDSGHFIVSPTAISLNAWHHLVATYDGATMRLYVDGAQVASSAAVFVIDDTTGDFRIGRQKDSSTDRYFHGLIDEVALYDYDLSPTQVAAHYAARLLPTWDYWAADPTEDRIVLAEVQPAEQLGAFTRDTTARAPYISIGADTLPATAGDAVTGSLPFTNNVITGAPYPDTLVLVRVAYHATGAISAITATYDGIDYALTKLGGAMSGNFRAEFWYLLDPPSTDNSGTYAITVTGLTDLYLNAHLVAGVDTADPFGTVATSTTASSTPSLNVTASATALVFDILSTTGVTSDFTTGAGAGQTQTMNERPGSDCFLGSYKDGSATTSISWTLSGTPANLAYAGVGVNGMAEAYWVDWSDQVQTDVVKGGVYRRLDSVRVDDTALTEQASVADVIANFGSYYYDQANQKLYVSAPSGSSPNVFAFVGAWFTVFLSTADPHFTGATDPLYEPRLTGQLPTIRGEVPDEMFGATIWADGTLEVANADAVWDKLTRMWIWENKRVTVKIGGASLAYDDYATVGTMRIMTVAADDLTMTLSVQEMSQVLNRSLPADTIDSFNIAIIGATTPVDGIIGAPEPIGYGRVSNCPLLFVEQSTASRARYIAFGYQFVHFNDQTDLDNVYAVNTVSGERVTLASPTDYFYNAADGHVDLFSTTYTQANGWTLVADINVASTGIATPIYPGTLAYLVLKQCGEDDANIDTAAFDQADLDAQMEVGLFLNQSTPAAEIMRQIEQSAFLRVYVGIDGKWTCKVFDPLEATVAAIVDEDFAGWHAQTEDQSVLSEVRVGYAYDPSTDTYTDTTESDSATQYGRETSDSHRVLTYLRNEIDAQDIAGKYAFLKQRTRAVIDAPQTSLVLSTAVPGDLVSVTRSRAPSISGAYDGAVMLVRALTLSLGPTVSVILTLDDMAEVLRLVGAYAGDTEINWSTATDAEKQTYAFYSDDDGYIDSSDATTRHRRCYW